MVGVSKYFFSGTMKQKTITICGKEVTLAYNFATEIAFFDLTDKDFSFFFGAIAAALQGKEANAVNVTAAVVSVSPKMRIMAILSAIMSYYQSVEQEPPITDRELMENASPEELFTALAAVIQLHNEWYHLPTGESVDKPAKRGKGKGKN